LILLKYVIEVFHPVADFSSALKQRPAALKIRFIFNLCSSFLEYVYLRNN